MKILRLGLLLFTLNSSLFTLHSDAQSASDLWISMPAKMTPYLDINMKKEMIECMKIGVDTSVKNTFDGKTKLDTLTNDYGKFLLSEARTLEIALLPCEVDSIVMLIDTYNGPAGQSRVEFYDMKWNCLSSDGKLPKTEMKDLIHKPDTMTVEDFDNLQKMIIPGFIVFNYDFTTKKLEIQPSLPLVTKDEKNKLNAVICKRTLKWDGKTFN